MLRQAHFVSFLFTLVAGLSSACGDSSLDSAGDGDYMDDDIPMGNCGATGCDTDDGGVPIGFPCAQSSDCAGEAACVAPFADGDVGESVCSAQCVPIDDESSWCLDSAACCDANAVCNPRGLCIPGESSLDSSGGATTTADTGDASSTGGSDSGGSDSGSGSGSGSGDGAADSGSGSGSSG